MARGQLMPRPTMAMEDMVDTEAMAMARDLLMLTMAATATEAMAAMAMARGPLMLMPTTAMEDTVETAMARDLLMLNRLPLPSQRLMLTTATEDTVATEAMVMVRDLLTLTMEAMVMADT